MPKSGGGAQTHLCPPPPLLKVGRHVPPPPLAPLLLRPWKSKITKQNKKKNKNTKGEREGASVFILHSLIRSKSNLAIETAFRTIMTIAFHKYDFPRCFLSAKTHLT